MNKNSRRRIVVGLLSALAVAEVIVCAALLVVGAIWAVRAWELHGWVLGTAGVLLLGALGYAAYRFLRAAYRRRFQFTLGGLLIATFVLALLLGTVGKQVQRYYAVHGVLVAGGRITQYASEEEGVRPFNGGRLQSHLGFDPFARLGAVDIWTDEALQRMAANAEYFADVEHLVLSGSSITDAGLAQADGLGPLPRLRSLSLLNVAVTDAGLESLCRWSSAETLCINSCQAITDDGLAHLARMRSLKYLMLISEGGGKVNVSDAGLTHLSPLSQLESLWFVGVRITDAGLVHLAKMKDLKEVHLVRTGVTEPGVQRLREALPNCKVNWRPK